LTPRSNCLTSRRLLLLQAVSTTTAFVDSFLVLRFLASASFLLLASRRLGLLARSRDIRDDIGHGLAEVLHALVKRRRNGHGTTSTIRSGKTFFVVYLGG
jgi:hypothetical protein